MISLIINTAAAGGMCPTCKAGTRSSAGIPHVMRSYALRNFIIPAHLHDPDIDELIVVGEWEEGEGYTYVPMPSHFMDWRDALAQRQAGFEASTGDILIFQHDDHLLDPHWSSHLAVWHSDVLVPQRHTRLRAGDGERLNNGEEERYISGHLAMYRRDVINDAPWGGVPAVRQWDIQHTKQILMAGYHIQWNSGFKCWDIEFGSKPWA